MLHQWIDVHAHFLPPLTAETQQMFLHAMRQGGWDVQQLPQWTPEGAIASMDRAGIAMQMLSSIPKSLDALRASNDYGASLVRRYPSRFGFLAALPTDDPDACLEEIKRAESTLHADGFAVTCCYNGVYLSDSRLDPVWAELDRRGAVVFAHPDAMAPSSFGRPCVVLEVAFETTRTFVDMLYAGTFRRFPHIKFVLSHGGGALPALSGRLMLLGDQAWIPNPNQVSTIEMEKHLRQLYLDTAATCPTTLGPALTMTTPDHIVYGSDCGAPCSTDETMMANAAALLAYKGLTPEQIEAIGHQALNLFPAAAARLKQSIDTEEIAPVQEISTH